MTPKESFLQSPHRQAHEAWTGTQAAEAARNSALLQFVNDLDRPSDPSKSWDQGCMIAGAKKVLEILFALHIKEEPKTFARMTILPPPS